MQHIDTVTAQPYDHIQKAQTVGGLLMSQGYPQDWNSSTVTVPGVVQDYRINSSKLLSLYRMSQLQLTTLFQTDYQLYIYVEQDGAMLSVGGYTFAGVEPNNPSNVAHVRRIALFDETPSVIHVVVWS